MLRSDEPLATKLFYDSVPIKTYEMGKHKNFNSAERMINAKDVSVGRNLIVLRVFCVGRPSRRLVLADFAGLISF